MLFVVVVMLCIVFCDELYWEFVCEVFEGVLWFVRDHDDVCVWCVRECSEYSDDVVVDVHFIGRLSDRDQCFVEIDEYFQRGGVGDGADAIGVWFLYIC